MESLTIYSKVSKTHSLGPFLRAALWVQGCPFNCSGCMTPNAIPFKGGLSVKVNDLAAEFLAIEGIEGITISGGEPFAQADALADLVQRLKEQRNLGVIVYSGYRLSQLKKMAQHSVGIARLLSSIDMLIDGLYVENLNQNAGFKGSENQVAHLLTQRYKEHIHLYQSEQVRQVELHVELNQEMLVGVPSKKQLDWWQQHKEIGKC